MDEKQENTEKGQKDIDNIGALLNIDESLENQTEESGSTSSSLSFEAFKETGQVEKTPEPPPIVEGSGVNPSNTFLDKELGVPLLLILISAVFGTYALINYTNEKQENIAVEEIFIPNPFDKIVLEAKTAIVLDLTDNSILYEKNASTTMPLASVTKLMSAYTALENAPEESVVVINREDIALEGDQGLLADEVWRMNDLIDFSLVTSSNDGISAIAGAVGKLSQNSEIHELNKRHFVELMNKTATNLGLLSMRFHNETGLDEKNGPAGGYGSAYDVAKLIGFISKKFPNAVTRTRDKEFVIESINGVAHKGKNTNLSAAAIPSLLVSKTGFTDMAGGNLAIIYDSSLNHPVTIVVLGSSLDGRFEDIEKLIDTTGEYIKNKKRLAN